MSDYIKREDAIMIMACEMFAESQAQGFPIDDVSAFMPEAKAWMNDAPSADVVERTSCKTCSNGEVDEGYVRCNSYRERGEWVEDKKTEREHQLYFHKVWTCPFCGEQECRPKPTNFCPNCGADMREESD